MGAGICDLNTQELNLEQIREQTRCAVTELLAEAKLTAGQILVVGCSSSEIEGQKIGTFSSGEVGKTVFETLQSVLKPRNIWLAAQCCEHLNRCLIVERICAEQYHLEEVNAVPKLKAGGSFATAAYAGFQDPVAVEHIAAHAGIDIGDTLIGMHLRSVAVPVRISVKQIGNAHVVCARTRLRYIGGERTSYKPS